MNDLTLLLALIAVACLVLAAMGALFDPKDPS